MTQKKQTRVQAAIYARYSTDGQNEQSIDDQILICKRYAEQNGFEVSEHHIFNDHAESGQNPNREEISEMMRRAESRAFEAVLTFTTSRVARDVEHMSRIRKTLAFLDIELVFVGHGIRTSQPSADLNINMLSVFDEYYVEEIRRHTRKALEGKPERGFVAGNLPFGYKVVKVGDSYVDSRGRIRAQGSKGVIVPEQADVVRRVFSGR